MLSFNDIPLEGNMKAIKIKLKKKENLALKDVLKKGTSKARTIMRCQVLLLSSQGRSPGFIAEALGITIECIKKLKKRYLMGGVSAAIYDKARPGAPTKFEGKHRAQITALACSSPPEGYAKWSLSLLADKAVELKLVDEISHTHVGRILKKTK